MSASPDEHAPPGVVELREDVPLKTRGASSGAAQCAGPRLILGAFAALSTAITLALLTQIYYGDYEVVPHGSVAGSDEACSTAGAAVLRAGGRALDAAATAALCLAVCTPHRTGLDAYVNTCVALDDQKSGSLLYWEYRTARTQGPLLAEWGGLDGVGKADDVTRPPRLVMALAALHAQLGVLPWARLLQPAIDMARGGFPVKATVARAATARGVTGYAEGSVRADPAIADYLHTLQQNTSAELCAAWSCGTFVRTSNVPSVAAGAWRVWAGGEGGRAAAAALAAAFPPPSMPPPSTGEAITSVVEALRQRSVATNAKWPVVASAGEGTGSLAGASVASGLAVVDPQDTYSALVTGLSIAFGSEAGAEAEAGGWTRDTPRAPLDLAPALLIDQHVCGTRYVVGAESAAALAQSAAAALAGAPPADAVEGGRVSLLPGGSLALEAGRAPPPSALLTALFGTPLDPLIDAPHIAPLNATPPFAAVNLVQQRGDALLSHTDSRGGGFASRF